jgi:hypothetical protein
MPRAAWAAESVLSDAEEGTGMTEYVIRLKGDLSSELTDAFPSLTADREPAQTVLHGDLDDQAALAGVLNHLDTLGVAIVGVLQVPPIPGNGR